MKERWMSVKREERIAAEGWGGGIMQSAVRLSRHAPLNMIELPQHPRNLTHYPNKEEEREKVRQGGRVSKVFNILFFFNKVDLFRSR